MNPLAWIAGVTDTAKAAIAGVMLIGLVGLGIALGITRSTLGHVREWQGDVVGAARLASDNPKLRTAAVANQITAMGLSIANLKGAIGRQTAAIADMGRVSDQGQKRLQDALRAGDRRKAELRGLQDRLRAAGAQKPAPGCESVPAAVEARGNV